MESNKSYSLLCTCKGIRICKICENNKNKLITNLKENYKVIDISHLIEYKNIDNNLSEIVIQQNKAIPYLNFLDENIKENIAKIKKELNLEINNISFNITDNIFEGLFIISKYISDKESEIIIEEMNKEGWIESQSGRMKQDYGPKINYKKRKVKNLPIENNNSFSQFYSAPNYLDEIISSNFNKIKLFNNDNNSNFIIGEMGNLLYSPDKGASIDPHIDHYWIWGRIIGINLLSDVIMTYSKEILIDSNYYLYEINIPIMKNQAYIMTGSSRYLWSHGIKRESIKSERIVITLREFEKGFLCLNNKNKIINK